MIVFKLLKNVILFIVREIASFMIKAFLIVLIIMGIVVNLGGDRKKKAIPIKNNSYLELDMAQEVTERGGVNFFAMEGENINFFNLLKVLENVKSDDRIRGVILKTDYVALNRAQIEEVSEKIDELKGAGKVVYSFSRMMDNKSYSLAMGASEIIMPPSKGSSVDIKGYYSESRYTKRLTDKIGVKYNVIHVGDYKAFGENYVREDMSPERRSDLTRILDTLYDEFVEGISERRNLSREELSEKILNGDFVLSDSFKLKEERLVDSLEYYHEFLENRGIEEIVTIGEYQRHLSERNNAKDKIAVVYAEGNILYQGNRSPKSVITPETLIKELDMAADDDDIKGIVLRVDSPGGSALASEVINARMKEIGKPIYISMGGVAASGGYYISTAGDRIFASPGTITGSIGVVSIIPNFSEISDKVGVNTEVIQRGRLAGIYSLFDEMTPEERERIYESSLGVYEEFKDRVSTGRGIDKQDLENLAGGRVWLGEEALENGLVDQMGGLEEAVKSMADSLELENYNVVEIKYEKPFEKFFMSYTQGRLLYERIEAMLNMDERAFVNKEELLVRPVMYMPYDI